jgi:TRAP-type C4-dicarboxylate transport system substrate-binding protein
VKATRLLSLVISVCLVTIFASLSTLTGCSQQAPAPAPAPAPTPSPAPAPTPAPTPAPAKTVELKLSDFWAPVHAMSIADDTFAKMVAERTGGKVKITCYHAEALGKQTAQLDMLAGGICDIANVGTPFHPGKFVMTLAPELPLLGIPNRTVHMSIMWELYYKGYFDKELNDLNVRLLAFMPTPPMTFFFRNKKVQTLEDWKGLKIRAPSPDTFTLLEGLGATPVAMVPADLYMALDRGILDGFTTGWEQVPAYKWQEVIKYACWNPNNIGAQFLLMNKDKWNSLDTESKLNIQVVMDEFKYEYLREFQDLDRNATDTLRKLGLDVYTIPENEWARIKALAAPIEDKWVADKESKGLPGKEMLDLIRAIMARYQ